MDRVKFLLGNDDSVLSNDYNWNDISLGNDTLACDNFFAAKHHQHERPQTGIVFEASVDELNENDPNVINVTNNSNSSESPMSTNSDQLADDTFESPVRNVPTKTAAQRKLPNILKTPNVVLAGRMYDEKKKIRMEQLVQKERDQRKFHAKPVPNFHSIHAARSQKGAADEPKFTIPKTPQVVHHHRKNLIRVKAKQQEIEAARQPKPFVSREADVLVQPPFVPQQSKKLLTEQVPFNLHSDERLRDRRQFNEHIRAETERREKEQEERRKIEDEQIRREIRKATTFKASPNPFS